VLQEREQHWELAVQAWFLGLQAGPSQSGSVASQPGEQQPSAPSSQATGSQPQPERESQNSTVQASPSSQLTLAVTQPVVGSQASAVQASLSSQSSGAPAAQAPVWRSQASAPLQALLSSQSALEAQGVRLGQEPHEL
jgi:hypothetical protein